jgi:hypothetical protein
MGSVYYLKLEDGTIWPNPLLAVEEVGRALVHGQPNRTQALVAASVIDAYAALATRPEFARRLPALRRAMRAAGDPAPPGEAGDGE